MHHNKTQQSTQQDFQSLDEIEGNTILETRETNFGAILARALIFRVLRESMVKYSFLSNLFFPKKEKFHKNEKGLQNQKGGGEEGIEGDKEEEIYHHGWS